MSTKHIPSVFGIMVLVEGEKFLKMKAFIYVLGVALHNAKVEVVTDALTEVSGEVSKQFFLKDSYKLEDAGAKFRARVHKDSDFVELAIDVATVDFLLYKD